MQIPNLWKDKERPNIEETVIDLMESIAMEEQALAQLIQSEARKINAFVGENGDFPVDPSTEEIVAFSQAVNRMMDSVLMKEWLLLRKLETIIGLKNSIKKDEKHE